MSCLSLFGPGDLSASAWALAAAVISLDRGDGG